MSEDNDVPPHAKLRDELSKQVRAISTFPKFNVHGAAIKDQTLVVFYVYEEDAATVRKREWNVKPSQDISPEKANQILIALYNQIRGDLKMMEIEEEKAALSQAVLASNPYGITANDVAVHGLSARELCGRRAENNVSLGAILHQVATMMDIDVTPDMVVEILQNNCPHARAATAKAPTTTRPVIWPAVATGAAAISQYNRA